MRALDPVATPKDDFTMSWLDMPALRTPAAPTRCCSTGLRKRSWGLPQDYRPDKGVPFDQIGL